MQELIDLMMSALNDEGTPALEAFLSTRFDQPEMTKVMLDIVRPLGEPTMSLVKMRSGRNVTEYVVRFVGRPWNGIDPTTRIQADCAFMVAPAADGKLRLFGVRCREVIAIDASGQPLPLQRPVMAPATPGAMVDLFRRLEGLPGTFTYDDAVQLRLILDTQALCGVRGDLVEIGCFHGQATAVLASALRPGERLVVCDLFDLSTGVSYGNSATPEVLVRNVMEVNPGLDPAVLDVRRCDSRRLELDPERPVRFAVVDAAHDETSVRLDIELCAKHLLPAGVICVDHYQHWKLPDVSRAVTKFLAAHAEFDVVADLNRVGEPDRKIYLRRR
jgi:hypothetical protein